jgi:hypothetical protein
MIGCIQGCNVGGDLPTGAHALSDSQENGLTGNMALNKCVMNIAPALNAASPWARLAME